MTSKKLSEFGDFRFFSILIRVDENPCGKWMNGYFYICVDSHILGNDSMVSLRDVMHELESFIDGRKERISESLFSLNATVIFNLITDSLYDTCRKSLNNDEIYNYISRDQSAGAFCIKPRVQSMSEVDIFSVTDNSNNAKIIYSLDQKNIKDSIVDEITMAESIASAYQYLKELHDNSESM